jgi:hypothetical protein
MAVGIGVIFTDGNGTNIDHCYCKYIYFIVYTGIASIPQKNKKATATNFEDDTGGLQSTILAKLTERRLETQS